MSWDIPGLLRPGTLGSVTTSTGLLQDIPGLSQDVPGYLRPGTLSVATSTDLSQDVLGYPGTTQTWDSRICGYLHRLISGCPGIIPGCSGIIPGQLRPGTLGSAATSTSLSQDVPGLSQDNSDLWLPPQAYHRISCDYPGMSRDYSDLGL